MDYIADGIYFVDIAIQFRTGYLEQGKSQSRLRHSENRLVRNCINFFIQSALSEDLDPEMIDSFL